MWLWPRPGVVLPWASRKSIIFSHLWVNAWYSDLFSVSSISSIMCKALMCPALSQLWKKQQLFHLISYKYANFCQQNQHLRKHYCISPVTAQSLTALPRTWLNLSKNSCTLLYDELAVWLQTPTKTLGLGFYTQELGLDLFYQYPHAPPPHSKVRQFEELLRHHAW